MTKKVTITDLAKRANVSVTTVSQILNGKEQRFSQKTVAKIKALQLEMGYVPDFNAQSLISRSGKTIGVIVPSINNPFFAEFNHGIDSYSASKGYTPLIFGSNNSPQVESRYLVEAIRRAADGMIIASAVSDVKETDKLLRQNGLPYLLIDRNPPVKGDLVDVQNKQGGQIVADYLHENGHHKIILVAPKDLTLNMELRIAGFKEKMKELGVDFSDDQIVHTELSMAGGYQITEKVLAAQPTAVFALNDELAVGLNRGFAEHDVRVPEDVSLIGYDNIDLAAYTIPSLTTMNQPAFEMGETAARLIIDRIENSDSDLQRVTLPIRLVKRNSVKKIN